MEEDDIYNCPAFLEVMREILEENLNYQPSLEDINMEDYYSDELP